VRCDWRDPSTVSMPLASAPLQPVWGVRWRGRLLGPVPPSQGSGDPGPVFYVCDVFVLLSCGF